MKIDELLTSILVKAKPTKEYVALLEKEATIIIQQLGKVGLKAMIGGSLAKGTLITTTDKPDVDLFVVFKKEEELDKFSKLINRIVTKGTLREVHGSRTYYQIEHDKAIFEIIPVLEHKHAHLAKNVTDFSLNHVTYIKQKIKKNKALADEIILAKTFFKANNLYGAESYLKGFSGYSLEVLTLHYGSFLNLIKGIQKSRIIDPENYFKNDQEVKRELNESKIIGPLIVVDPTYKYRNVCAGLGFETHGKAVLLAKEFLKNPSITFFEKKNFDVNSLKKYAQETTSTLVEITLSTDRQEGDIAGTKMKKLLDFITMELLRKQQTVKKKEFVYEGKGKKAKGYLVIKEQTYIEIKGPPKNLKEAVKKFTKAKGKAVYMKGKDYYYKEKVSLKELFQKITKYSKEMGAKANMKILN